MARCVHPVVTESVLCRPAIWSLEGLWQVHVSVTPPSRCRVDLIVADTLPACVGVNLSISDVFLSYCDHPVDGYLDTLAFRTWYTALPRLVNSTDGTSDERHC